MVCSYDSRELRYDYRGGSGTPAELLDDANIPIVITEGENKGIGRFRAKMSMFLDSPPELPQTGPHLWGSESALQPDPCAARYFRPALLGGHWEFVNRGPMFTGSQSVSSGI